MPTTAKNTKKHEKRSKSHACSMYNRCLDASKAATSSLDGSVSWLLYNTASPAINRCYSLLSHPMGVRGNVRISPIARGKARCRLPIRYNWTFFASSYCWDVISRYWSKSAFFKRGWVTLSANFKRDRTSPTNLFWCLKTRLITLSCGIKISAVCCFISSQSTHVTDRQTNGETDRITIPKTALA